MDAKLFPPQRTKPVYVLMAVYNGEDCLDDQLDSIFRQTHPLWHIITSDDGSSDDSSDILRRYSAQLRSEKAQCSVTNLQGPKQGAAANFMFLIRHLADAASKPEWLTFSDQDDVWLTQKMDRGLRALATVDPDIPALYCSRTWIATTDLSQRRISAPRPRPPAFQNALVQNIASGNTILLNPAATSLVLRSVLKVEKVVIHDWWIYQLVTGAGGQVIHDDTPGLLYRQHAVNQIGANDTFRARIKRIGQLLRGDFRDWNKINIAALSSTAAELTEANRLLLTDFAHLPNLPLFKRLMLLRRMGLYRQTMLSNLALWFAVIFNRV